MLILEKSNAQSSCLTSSEEVNVDDIPEHKNRHVTDLQFYDPLYLLQFNKTTKGKSTVKP
jgi:hypothetical protein